MRDALLAVVLLAIAFRALKHPWIGVMGWTWLSLMNPHSYSFQLKTMPVAALFAGATLLGLAFTRDRRSFFVTPETVALIVFMLWMCITFPFSFEVGNSYDMWSRVMKIDFMVLVTMVLLHSRKHIMAFVWVTAGSIAFYGIKGGIFTIATGGGHRVWGPEGTFIEGNNEVALALVIIIPLMRFLQVSSESRYLRLALTAAMILCAAAALGTQ